MKTAIWIGVIIAIAVAGAFFFAFAHPADHMGGPPTIQIVRLDPTSLEARRETFVNVTLEDVGNVSVTFRDALARANTTGGATVVVPDAEWPRFRPWLESVGTFLRLGDARFRLNYATP